MSYFMLTFVFYLHTVEYLCIKMPCEEHEESGEDNKEKSEFESVFFKFRFSTDILEQADSTPP